jgi:hypothetical protein
VVGIVGDWTANPKPLKNTRTLRFGSEVSSDDRISGSSRGGSILIVSRSANTSYRFFKRCEDMPCEYLFKQENKPAEAPGFFSRLYQAVLPLIQGRGDTFIAAVSREWGQDLKEAVTPLFGGELDLSPALESLDAGSYFVRLERIGAAASPGQVFPLQWVPGTPARLPRSAAAPGLYKLLLVRSNGEPAGTESWILVAASSDAVRLASSFRQAVEATASWANEMDADAARPLLRAYLQSLAEERR